MPKNTPTRIIDERSRFSTSFIGGGGAGAGVTDHGLLSGLTDDDHLQYLTNARGDARYVPLARTVTGTTGLAGGGALSGNISLTLASSAAGDGLTYSSGVLAVGVSGLGLSVGADAVTLTSSSAPGANARILASTAAGGLTLQQLDIGAAMTFYSGNVIADGPDILFDQNALIAGESSIYLNIDSDNNSTTAALIIQKDAQTNAGTEIFRFNEDGTANFSTKLRVPLLDTVSGNMTIQPGGDLVLDPGGYDVLPGGSVQDDLGDYNRKWRTLFAAELYVETLVAQDVLSTIGGRIEVTPTTTLIADLSSAATTMDVKHNNLRIYEWAYLMAAPGGVAQMEVLRVNSAATAITGGFRYTILRDRPSGAAPDDWVAGDAVASLGKNVGEGHISLTATNTIYNHLGPTIAIYSRTANTSYANVAATVALGNLESFVDYSAPTFGLAIGNDLTKDITTGFMGLTADATDGLRLFSTAISAYNGATQTFYLAPTGLDMWLGPSSADKRLTWNGTTLGIVGSVVATTGYIGGSPNGWAIAAGLLSSTGIKLYSGDSYTARIELGDGTAARTAGIRSYGTGAAADTAIWAGSAHDDTSNAKTRITFGGSLYSTDATFGTLQIDTSGAFVEAPNTWSLTTYGYKFKYGASVGAGLTAVYIAGASSRLDLADNATTASSYTPLYNIDSTLSMRATAGGAGKTARANMQALHGSTSYAGIEASNDGTNRIVTVNGTSFLFNTSTIWHSGNDGTGSTLDADLLDGMQATEFPSLSAGGTFTGPLSFSNTVVKFTSVVAEPAYATIGNGEIWLYMMNAGSGARKLKARGKGTGGGTAEATIITTGL